MHHYANVTPKPRRPTDPTFLRCKPCASLLRADHVSLQVRGYSMPQAAFMLECPVCQGVTRNPAACTISGETIHTQTQPGLEDRYPTPEETLRYLANLMGVPAAEIEAALART